MNTGGEPRQSEPGKPEVQIKLVLDAVANDRIGAWPHDKEMGYLYERRVISVRDALTQVADLVGGEPVDGLVDGVTAWSLPEREPTERPASEAPAGPWRPQPSHELVTEVTAALELIDARLGAGVASPNHSG